MDVKLFFIPVNQRIKIGFLVAGIHPDHRKANQDNKIFPKPMTHEIWIFFDIFRGILQLMIEIQKGSNNTFQFQLKTADGQTLFESVDFKTKWESAETVYVTATVISEQNIKQERVEPISIASSITNTFVACC